MRTRVLTPREPSQELESEMISAGKTLNSFKGVFVKIESYSEWIDIILLFILCMKQEVDFQTQVMTFYVKISGLLRAVFIKYSDTSDRNKFIVHLHLYILSFDCSYLIIENYCKCQNLWILFCFYFYFQYFDTS